MNFPPSHSSTQPTDGRREVNKRRQWRGTSKGTSEKRKGNPKPKGGRKVDVSARQGAVGTERVPSITRRVKQSREKKLKEEVQSEVAEDSIGYLRK